MKKLWVKYKKSIIHLVKFGVVGAINFGVDSGIGYLLVKVAGTPILLGNTISYSCGVVNSFLLNRYWTFKQKKKFLSLDFLKFVIVNVISLAINDLTMHVFFDMYSMNYFAAKVLATVFSFVVNFAGSKFLVFTDKEEEKELKNIK